MNHFYDHFIVELDSVWSSYTFIIEESSSDSLLNILYILHFTFSHLADAFIQSDLQLGST